MFYNRKKCVSLVIFICCFCLFLKSLPLQAVETETSSKQHKMPKFVAKVLCWFPSDTENLIAGKNFSIAKGLANLNEKACSLACGPLPKPLLEELNEFPVQWAVHGGRNTDGVSAFGSIRQEGVAVIHFANDLSKEKMAQLTKRLQQEAKEVRQIANHTVYVYASSTVMEPVFKLKPWQADYVVILDRHTLMTASSDVYLKQVLERMNSSAKRVALPASLPQWKYVDFSAATWFLRHLPKRNEQMHQSDPKKERDLLGLVWMVNREKEEFFRLIAIPISGKKVPDILNKRLFPRSISEKNEKELKRFVSKSELPNGTRIVSITSSVNNHLESRKLLGWISMFFLHQSQGIWE